MPMYNLIEHNINYSKSSRTSWQFCKYILPVNNSDAIFDSNGTNTISTWFNLKAKIRGQTSNLGTKYVEIMVPVKYLSKFWRTLEMPLANCDFNLDLN